MSFSLTFPLGCDMIPAKGVFHMSVSNILRMAASKKGMNQAKLAEACGTSPQAFANKFSRDTWTAKDLMKIASVTGGRLAFIYPDGQQLFFVPDEAEE